MSVLDEHGGAQRPAPPDPFAAKFKCGGHSDARTPTPLHTDLRPMEYDPAWRGYRCTFPGCRGKINDLLRKDLEWVMGNG